MSGGEVRHSIQAVLTIFTKTHLASLLYLHYGDLTDTANLLQLISDIKPDEIYNLAAQSHVGVSFQQPNIQLTLMRLKIYAF